MMHDSEKPSEETISIAKRKRPLWSIRLKEARGSVGLSQADLASKIGSSQSTIGDYEAGRSEPSLSVFAKISRACNVSQAWLILGIGSINDKPSKQMSFEQSLRYFEENKELSEIARKLYLMYMSEKFPFDFEFIIVVAKRIFNELLLDNDYFGNLTPELLEKYIEREQFRVRKFFYQARIEMMSTPATEFYV